MKKEDTFTRSLAARNGLSDVQASLLFVGGGSERTKSGINVSQVAKKLGRSPATIRRWIRNGEIPKGPIRTKVQRAQKTKTGRKNFAAAQLQNSKMQGIQHLTVSGYMGPAGEDRSYFAPRIATIPINDDDRQGLVNAYTQGGESAAHEYMMGRLSRPAEEGGYVSGFTFHPSANGRFTQWKFKD